MPCDYRRALEELAGRRALEQEAAAV
jgi:hypothetical protein